MHLGNSDLQYLAGDEWCIVHNRYFRHEEMQERLGAYCTLSIKYLKSILKIEAAQLIFNTDERHRVE